MKVKVRVHSIFTIKDRVIFNVEILAGDYYNRGDVFETDTEDLKFKLLGIGMDNQMNSIDKSFLVKPFISSSDLDTYLGQVFIKKV